MMGMLEETLSIIRPPSTHTLPTVTATLSGVVQAAETAALAVLDEAEALQGDQQDLDRAIVKLRGHLPADNAANADALAVLDEVARCSKAFADRAMKFMAAMEFQDLASQHIGRVTKSIEEVRERLARALSLFDLQDPEVAVAVAPTGADAIGDPTRRHGAGQALADQLLAERG
jgi:chemotaxis regulatin CheY-phosphate phosphatase CheZ